MQAGEGISKIRREEGVCGRCIDVLWGYTKYEDRECELNSRGDHR